MDILQALDTILDDPSRWPIPSRLGDEHIFLNTALCLISGMLPQCDDATDLRTAARHGLKLVTSGRIPLRLLEAAARYAEQSLAEWAEAHSPASAEAAELIASHAAEPVPKQRRRVGKVYNSRSLNVAEVGDEFWDDD